MSVQTLPQLEHRTLRLTVRVTPRIVETLEAIAQREQNGLSAVTRRILMRGLEAEQNAEPAVNGSR